jgi:hypothetical protein
MKKAYQSSGKEASNVLSTKKRDELLCNNYRDISLLSTSYKILTGILKRRLEPFLKRILEHQAGFQPGTSNTDDLFILIQMTEKCREYKADIYIFVDFKQAYDCTLCENLETALLEMGIPVKLVKLLNATSKETSREIKIQNELTDIIIMRHGLKQGDILAPLLFSLALKYVTRQVNVTQITCQHINHPTSWHMWMI